MLGVLWEELLVVSMSQKGSIFCRLFEYTGLPQTPIVLRKNNDSSSIPIGGSTASLCLKGRGESDS